MTPMFRPVEGHRFRPKQRRITKKSRQEAQNEKSQTNARRCQRSLGHQRTSKRAKNCNTQVKAQRQLGASQSTSHDFVRGAIGCGYITARADQERRHMKLLLLGILLLVPGRTRALFAFYTRQRIHTLSIWPRASCTLAWASRFTPACYLGLTIEPSECGGFIGRGSWCG